MVFSSQLAYQAYMRGEMKIVVLYNAASINKNKCPELLKGIGTHKEMKSYKDCFGRYMFDYSKVRNAIEN